MHARFGFGVIALGLFFSAAGPAEADEGVCTYGDAQALFQELPIAIGVIRPRQERPRLVQNLARCQYRVFSDGQTFTFHDDDYITGGLVWLYEYVALGVPRAAAIADIELNEDHVYLARVRPDGTTEPAVEQPLMRSAYKNVNHPALGITVFQHRAFIRQLPAGEYVSTWVSTYPGTEPLTATIRLVILPR